ncbi:MAG: ECF transporter S component [Candidatus Caldatribacteriaceae bacterium]
MKEKVRFLVYSGIGIALVTVVTMMVQVPVPQTKGYINLGEAMILVLALLFGWKIGFVAGGFGSALADILGGYTHWAPFTLIIKGIEGLLVGLGSGEKRWTTKILFCILGTVEMVGGYFFAEVFLYGRGAALAELPGNFLQAASGVIIAPLFVYLISRIEGTVTHRV